MSGRIRRHVILPLLPAAGLAQAADAAAAPPAPTLKPTQKVPLAPTPATKLDPRIAPRPLPQAKPAEVLLVTDLSMSAPIAVVGKSVRVRAAVKNAGKTALADVAWRLEVGTETRAGKVASIAPGATATIEQDFPSGSPGEKSVKLTIDDRAERVTRGTLVVAPTAPPGSWAAWSQGAASRVGALVARVKPASCFEGTVNATTLTVTRLDPGGADLGALSQLLASDGLPPFVAQALADAFWDSYKAWASGVRGAQPGAFPSFAAVPSPQGPPTPSAPAPVIIFAATAESTKAFSAPEIEAKIRARLGARIHEPGASDAMKSLAVSMSSQLNTWVTTQLVTVTGIGPVPTFAPPYVPVGPVVNGSVLRPAGACNHLP